MPKWKPRADPLVEYVPLEIDGVTYRLAFDFNALANAEKASGANLLHGLAGMLCDGWTAAEVRGLLYAALLKAHPKMTPDDAGRLVLPETLPLIQAALIQAYNASLPEDKKILRPLVAVGEAAPPAESLPT